MIDLTIYPEILDLAVRRARERNVIIPTFKQQRYPGLIPAEIAARLKRTGLWDLDPLNLFRITWRNEPTPKGGGFGAVNAMGFPAALTGVEARLIAWSANGSRPEPIRSARPSAA